MERCVGSEVPASVTEKSKDRTEVLVTSCLASELCSLESTPLRLAPMNHRWGSISFVRREEEGKGNWD